MTEQEKMEGAKESKKSVEEARELAVVRGGSGVYYHRTEEVPGSY